MDSFTKLAFAALAVAAFAIPAVSGGLAVGKKLEVHVDPVKLHDERAALWARFGGWCSIRDWHPAIADCKEMKEGNADYRILTLKDGATIKERLIDRQEFLYKYEIVESPLPVKNYQAQFALTPDDDDDDEINFAWAAVFEANGKPDKDAVATIDGIFKAGLDNIEAMTKNGNSN